MTPSYEDGFIPFLYMNFSLIFVDIKFINLRISGSLSPFETWIEERLFEVCTMNQVETRTSSDNVIDENFTVLQNIKYLECTKIYHCVKQRNV